MCGAASAGGGRMPRGKTRKHAAKRHAKAVADTPTREHHGPRRWLVEGYLSQYDRAPPGGESYPAGSPSALPGTEPRRAAAAWQDAFAEYKLRKQTAAAALAAAAVLPTPDLG